MWQVLAATNFDMNQTLLVTGGAGYIGSHTVLTLLQAGHDVVVLDNLCNSSPEALRRVAQIAGRAPVFVQGDVRDAAVLRQLFGRHRIDAVLHFAGLKAVGESVRQPLRYYDHNVAGTLALCQAMADAGVFRLVFSSSATVYGDVAHMPISEAWKVVDEAKKRGVKRLILTHPEEIVDASLNDVKGIAAMGAFVEHSLCMFLEGSKFKVAGPDDMRKLIDAAGVEQTIMCSDLGQPGVFTPLEGFRLGAKMCLDLGFTDDEVHQMVSTNAARAHSLEADVARVKAL